MFLKKTISHFSINISSLICLISPQTSDERIRFIDKVSNGFIYMVSSFSITGAVNSFGENQIDYFKALINEFKI